MELVTGVLLQTLFFFIFMLAANYFIMQRKRADRMKASISMSAIAAVIYGIVMYVWRVA